MNVVDPIVRSPEFYFNSTTFSPFRTAPSSPIPFGEPFGYQYHYTSAPASPAQAAAIQSQITAWAHPNPDSRCRNDNGGDVFDFAFSPSRYNQPFVHRSPEITASGKLFEKGRVRQLRERRRNSVAANSLRNGRRKSRSLSPLRDVGLLAKSTSPSTTPVKCGLSRKWPRLKDLFLFRSASEGRVTGRGSKDPLQNYTILPSVSPVNKKRGGEDKKVGGGSGGGGQETVRRGNRPAVSAHEKHYTENRAAAEEQKRKTALPFQRHGLLGLTLIDFSPAIRGKNKVVAV